MQQRRIIFKHIDEPGYTNDLACYQRNGGYDVLRKAVARPPAELIDEVKKSGVRGRGGAGFPAGVKWNLVDRKSGKPIYLVVNADESEPGTFKDRYIIHQDPHQLIEGTMITCFANNVKQAYIYIRGEMPEGARILERAIAEARAANLVGPNILGTGYSCEIYVHRGAGAYICGEETGLIESLEGKRANPRIKPPYFPAVLGLYQCPTIVNNVETICHVKHIIDMGGEAFAKIGTPNNTGTRIYCVSGHVQRPGYYEFECGKITLGQLLNDVCGGPRPGRAFKAVIPGGSSSKILRFGETFTLKNKDGSTRTLAVEDIPMDFDTLAACGTMGGSGGVIVMDDTVNMVEALANINAFYAHESCGQCTPCREGSLWMKRITARMVHGAARAEDAALLKNVADQIPGRTICAMGEACAWPTQSYVEKFPEDFGNYYETKKTPRPAGAPQLV
ncbi:NADH-quinone oxidoreductase subunit NuoF [Ereboglobus luteus]|uniref:NADH-quinone oxidoreductase subunit F n=1 Tax=Ereboglobus luteus TaxID=1796921 RepID=A0A2U8DZ87_9BACT|nr:NADH-quinone oxidoreductase subunit NuoF [Ereboglobus luteus]AWI07937.1 NADH-quinone oxidoreductase subunit F [Ereboglobus luteus]